MKSEEFIKEFHNNLWINPDDLPYMDFKYYYSRKEDDNYHNRSKPNFDPHYNISEWRNSNIPKEWGVFGETNDRVISEHMTSNFNAVVDKFVGNIKEYKKKFSIGEYNFYIYFNSGVFENKNSIQGDDFYYCEDFSVYFEYKGFSNKILNLYKQEKKDGEKLNYRNLKIEGYFVVLEFLKQTTDILVLLEDYDFKEVFGDWEHQYYFSFAPITPKDLCKYTKKKSKYSISRKYDIEPIKPEVNLDFFIEMFTEKGVYKPNKKVVDKLFLSFNNELKTKAKSLKDLGVDIVQFKNNTAYDITKFYDLAGVSIKCSESVLKNSPNLRKFHINQELAKNVSKKEKEDKIRIERERVEKIANDTYTLYQFGIPILKDVRSYEIEEYIKNKNKNNFQKQAISAAKKVFEASSEIDVIYFMHYGIYTYTEMAGEKFAHYEDLEYINKLKNNKLPKRVVTLLNLEEITFPFFDKYDDNITFESGATFIGVKKSGDNYVVIYENGEQGI